MSLADDIAHEHPHPHEDGGFDIVLPNFKSDILLWSTVIVAAGYLAYLVYQIIVGPRKAERYRAGFEAGKEAAQAEAAWSKLTENKPSDESKGL